MSRLLENGDVSIVIGYVDSYGAIHARTIRFGEWSSQSQTHTSAENLSGRTFRWYVGSQDFGQTLRHMRGDLNLSEEDRLNLLDWLVREGYRDEEDLYE